MAATRSSLKSKSFVYDFAVDGGAISSIPMGIFFSTGVALIGICYNQITAFVGGAGATFAVGTLSGTASLTRSGVPEVAAGWTGTGSTMVIMGTAFTFTLLNEEVLFTIAVNTLTAGRMIQTIYYQEYY
jgi:hypothetical protein